MKSARFRWVVAAVAACLLSGCEASRKAAVGNMSSIIVIAADSLWSAIGDSVTRALEPRIYTVRDERMFEVTQVSPSNQRWSELRMFRNVLAIGTAQDGWIAPALSDADEAAAPAPFVFHGRDVWARNQFVTTVVVPAQNSAEAALSLAAQAATSIDSLFRAFARERMFASDPDTLLRDSLRATAGFSILLPSVYQTVRRTSNLYLFQNSSELGGDLVRSILVSVRDGLLEPTAELAAAWRDSASAEVYRPTQTTPREHVHARTVQVGGSPGVEIQGAWEGNDPAWPMGGTYIARIVQCPAQNRTYFIDGWLYAPGGQRGTRYEYIVQLQTIIDTFACAN